MPPIRRVIVIGLDGVDPSLVEAQMRSGELPNLARLRRTGGYAPLATTTPAQTPVAWSTFATGVNPGGHGVFDFLRRDPGSYLPDLSLSRFERRGRFLPPVAVNLRRGTPLWTHLSARDIPSVVLRCPGTYPPDAPHGRLLSGMGVPDVRGGLGTATLLTTDRSARAGEGEQVGWLEGERSRLRGALIGPRHPGQGTDLTTPVGLSVAMDGLSATLESDGNPGRLSLNLGEWSDWLHLRFRAGWLVGVRAVVRVLLLRTAPHVELYVSPANFDPGSSVYPISHPPRYAGELARELGGAYYTTGMVEDHTGLTNGRLSESQFLAQCELAMRERVAMMRYELDRLREGLFFILFDTPDRIQHMFWRYREPNHPANRASPADSREMSRVIEEHYRHCDDVVGEAVRAADDETLLLVLSDHGFTSFQRGVHLNDWLHQRGYLALRGGASPHALMRDFLAEVDWARTRAYALGLGSIYLNQAGRERDGIVPPADADALAARIAGELAGLRDPERGEVAVVRAHTRRDLYRGPYADESPDVVVACNRGYRASWSTVLGGFGGCLMEDNTRRWGGDHIVEPSLVPGVLFSNRALRAGMAEMVDLMPTILSGFGAPVPEYAEGKQLITWQ